MEQGWEALITFDGILAYVGRNANGTYYATEGGLLCREKLCDQVPLETALLAAAKHCGIGG